MSGYGDHGWREDIGNKQMNGCIGGWIHRWMIDELRHGGIVTGREAERELCGMHVWGATVFRFPEASWHHTARAQGRWEALRTVGQQVCAVQLLSLWHLHSNQGGVLTWVNHSREEKDTECVLTRA